MHPYDRIAARYDSLFDHGDARSEDARLFARIAYRGGAVLDIGCGTGLALDHIAPESYLGIDPSAGMLDVLLRKHPTACVERTDFESFRTLRRFDLILALYGVVSYISAPALQRIPHLLTPSGRYFLMAYRPGYRPVTYERSGVEVGHFHHSADVLPGSVREVGNYLVFEGTAHEVLPEADGVRRRARPHPLAV